MKRVLLIHQYAGNKGDRAVALAMCKLMRELEPTISITISTSSPTLWKNEPFYEQNGIKFVTGGWNFSLAKPRWYWGTINRFSKYTFSVLRTLYMTLGRNIFSYLFISPEFRRVVTMSDIIISVGGHHFTTLLSKDLVSPINYDAMSVLSMGKPLVCFSQSFGPFNFYKARNKRLTSKILCNCSLILPREEESANELLMLGVSQDRIKRTYESVITLCHIVNDYKLPSLRENRVGIAVYAPRKREELAHLHYVTVLVDVCDGIHKRGGRVCFFPMEIKGTGPDDRSLIYEIVGQVQHPELCYVFDDDMTTERHILEVSKCRLFIGHKTHSTIFAMATGTPLIGIAYHVKTKAFMRQFGVEEFCICEQELSMEKIIEKYDRMSERIDSIGRKLYSSACKMAESVRNDMQLVLDINCNSN